MGRLIIAANRLPISVGKQIRKSSGGLVAALEGVAGREETLWMGWPGKQIDDAAQRERLEDYCRQHGLAPVYLSKDEADAYYRGFSNRSLWPILHYMPDYAHYDDAWWQDYRRINRRFADRLLDTAQEGDSIWVHDYHLMLLPRMLRQDRLDLRIGFFLHTPFPSYEVFRCHPRREELLEGLLGADLVGFHTFGYLRHFRSAVLRILGRESDMGGIDTAGRRTHIGVYPIGINAGRFEKELAGEKFARRREELIEAFRGKRIVLNVERLDYTKGIGRRLEAIDIFLDDWPDKDNIVFVFISVPSRGEVPEYQLLRRRITRQVGRTNGRHSTTVNTPIRFIHKAVDFTELCVLYSLADVAMVTPLRDGMNLVAKEYVACQGDQAGTLILSEFAGATEELFNALVVNPYDVQAVAARLRDALALGEDERRARMAGMTARVRQFDADWWARSFLLDLAEPAAPVETIQPSGAWQDVLRTVRQRFAAARRIACFLDYDGTLREFETDPAAAGPTPEIRDLLSRLAGLGGTEVFLISGRRPEDLDRWFGSAPLTLIAEHGFLWRRSGWTDWQPLTESPDLTWKPQVLKMLRHYEGTTPGSSVEDKHSAVVWHYRAGDPEFGQWKANQLVSELREMTANLPVEVRHGHKIVEVTSVHASKRLAVTRSLQEADYDLVFCAGDDTTDEAMFQAAPERAITVKVGRGDTHAAYRLAGPNSLRELLRHAAEAVEQAAGGAEATQSGKSAT